MTCFPNMKKIFCFLGPLHSYLDPPSNIFVQLDIASDKGSVQTTHITNKRGSDKVCLKYARSVSLYPFNRS